MAAADPFAYTGKRPVALTPSRAGLCREASGRKRGYETLAPTCTRSGVESFPAWLKTRALRRDLPRLAPFPLGRRQRRPEVLPHRKWRRYLRCPAHPRRPCARALRRPRLRAARARRRRPRPARQPPPMRSFRRSHLPRRSAKSANRRCLRRRRPCAAARLSRRRYPRASRPSPSRGPCRRRHRARRRHPQRSNPRQRNPSCWSPLRRPPPYRRRSRQRLRPQPRR